MKKNLIGMIVITFLLLGGYAYGGCLRVYSPNGGEHWFLGTSQNIIWTNSCGKAVKIVLKKGASSLGNIATNLPASQHSYHWTVGHYQGGTAPLGNDYRIRVKTMDGTVKDTSDSNFSISNSPNLQPIPSLHSHIQPFPALSRPDLKVTQTTLEFLQSPTKKVRFVTAIINAGNVKATNIKLRLRITGPAESPLNNHSQTMIYPSLSAGMPITYIRKFHIHTPGKYHFTFTADPDNSISEINENNNTVTRNITINAPDLIVWLRNPKVHMTKKQTIYIGVLNIGNIASKETKLKVHIEGKGTKEYVVPCLRPCKSTFIKRKERFYSNRDKWVKMTIDPYNQVTELRKDNNFTRTKLDVRAWGHFGARVLVPPPVNRCW